MEPWKEFGQNPVTHSAAHHLVAIEGLIGEYGYARVTDVAKRLSITRGSASITIRNLKTRGFVRSDSRGFLRLSDDGMKIVRGVQAKKSVIKKLFTDLLGVGEEQANIDACKIEHLISGMTAERVTRLLRFVDSGCPEAGRFREAFAAFEEACDGNPIECSVCDDDCLAQDAARMPGGNGGGRGEDQ
ncbi:MAG: metal-dependent transcriptional regulator [Candidatus Eisenbacteria bacterium]